ncbi:hypothetical protein VTN31DRAFT_7152 [Thermomyces dupontii]|uniref:uncharacterized protein n=1 Tax=Talaromyces thermophilus TaxID=28565 RepID=UPI003742FB00
MFSRGARARATLLLRGASVRPSPSIGAGSSPLQQAAIARRLLSTAPPAQKSRSWKNLLVRLGLAGAAVYYYNTSTVFAEEPSFSLLPPSATPTVEEDDEPQPDARLQDHDESQAAFNPETGEINWDCPCLGGMAYGPCGEEFRAAFSCFVYSKEEPKGMDCIDKFKAMQDCFRQHPDVYGSQLEDDEEVDEQLTQQIAEADRQKQAEAQSQAQSDAPLATDATAATESAPASASISTSVPADQPSSSSTTEESIRASPAAESTAPEPTPNESNKA